jgi:hypothetical protein
VSPSHDTSKTKTDAVPESRFRQAQVNALPMWLAMGAPVLPAYPASRDTVWVMCPHCRVPHYHGRRDGHRIAHCLDVTSPLRVTGYVLHEVPLPYDAGCISGLAPTGAAA